MTARFESTIIKVFRTSGELVRQHERDMFGKSRQEIHFFNKPMLIENFKLKEWIE